MSGMNAYVSYSLTPNTMHIDFSGFGRCCRTCYSLTPNTMHIDSSIYLISSNICYSLTPNTMHIDSRPPALLSRCSYSLTPNTMHIDFVRRSDDNSFRLQLDTKHYAYRLVQELYQDRL